MHRVRFVKRLARDGGDDDAAGPCDDVQGDDDEADCNGADYNDDNDSDTEIGTAAPIRSMTTHRHACPFQKNTFQPERQSNPSCEHPG